MNKIFLYSLCFLSLVANATGDLPCFLELNPLGDLQESSIKEGIKIVSCDKEATASLELTSKQKHDYCKCQKERNFFYSQKFDKKTLKEKTELAEHSIAPKLYKKIAENFFKKIEESALEKKSIEVYTNLLSLHKKTPPSFRKLSCAPFQAESVKLCSGYQEKMQAFFGTADIKKLSTLIEDRLKKVENAFDEKNCAGSISGLESKILTSRDLSFGNTLHPFLIDNKEELKEIYQRELQAGRRPNPLLVLKEINQKLNPKNPNLIAESEMSFEDFFKANPFLYKIFNSYKTSKNGFEMHEIDFFLDELTPTKEAKEMYLKHNPLNQEKDWALEHYADTVQLINDQNNCDGKVIAETLQNMLCDKEINPLTYKNNLKVLPELDSATQNLIYCNNKAPSNSSLDHLISLDDAPAFLELDEKGCFKKATSQMLANSYKKERGDMGKNSHLNGGERGVTVTPTSQNTSSPLTASSASPTNQTVTAPSAPSSVSSRQPASIPSQAGSNPYAYPSAHSNFPNTLSYSVASNPTINTPTTVDEKLARIAQLEAKVKQIESDTNLTPEQKSSARSEVAKEIANLKTEKDNLLRDLAQLKSELKIAANEGTVEVISPKSSSAPAVISNGNSRRNIASHNPTSSSGNSNIFASNSPSVSPRGNSNYGEVQLAQKIEKSRKERGSEVSLANTPSSLNSTGSQATTSLVSTNTESIPTYYVEGDIGNVDAFLQKNPNVPSKFRLKSSKDPSVTAEVSGTFIKKYGKTFPYEYSLTLIQESKDKNPVILSEQKKGLEHMSVARVKELNALLKQIDS